MTTKLQIAIGSALKVKGSITALPLIEGNSTASISQGDHLLILGEGNEFVPTYKVSIWRHGNPITGTYLVAQPWLENPDNAEVIDGDWLG